jgi:hypothetical protein
MYNRKKQLPYGAQRGFLRGALIEEVRFALDSPLEGRVRSEPVSKLGRFRAILDGNKLVFGAENREESQPWLAIVWRVTASNPL